MKVNIALLTVTDTRTIDNDKSGGILVNKIKEANHNLIDRKICKDDKNDIAEILKEWLKSKEIDHVPDFFDVLDKVSVDAKQAARLAANKAYYEGLRERYNVVLPETLEEI